jgi:hypothetical protein
MDAVLDVLSEDFDMIVVDTSPVLAVTDAAALAGKVGSVLVVAGARTSRRRELDRMMGCPGADPARVLGFVLNRSSASKVLSYAPAVPAYEDEDEDEAPVEPRYEAPAARHPTARVDLLPSAEVVQHPGASFGRSGPGPAADDPGPSVPWEEPGHAVLLAPEPEQPASLTPEPSSPRPSRRNPSRPRTSRRNPSRPRPSRRNRSSPRPSRRNPSRRRHSRRNPSSPRPLRRTGAARVPRVGTRAAGVPRAGTRAAGSPESDPVLPERTAAWDPLFEPYAAEDPSSTDHVLPPVQAPAGGWPAPGSAEPDPPVHAEPPRSTDVALADPAVPALTPTDLVPPSPPRRHLGADSLGWVDTVLGRGWLPASGRSGDRHQESAAERGATAPPDGDAAPEQAQAGDWRSTGTGWADRTG